MSEKVLTVVVECEVCGENFGIPEFGGGCCPSCGQQHSYYLTYRQGRIILAEEQRLLLLDHSRMKKRQISVTIKVGNYALNDMIEIDEDELSGRPERGQRERIQTIVDDWVLAHVEYNWEDVTGYTITPDALGGR